MLDRLIPFIRNKYVIAIFVSGMWMLFFDRYNLLSQRRMSYKIEQLRKDKAMYEKGIARIDYERDKLFNNQEELERFARERYWMKRKNEDVYLIIEE